MNQHHFIGDMNEPPCEECDTLRWQLADKAAAIEKLEAELEEALKLKDQFSDAWAKKFDATVMPIWNELKAKLEKLEAELDSWKDAAAISTEELDKANTASRIIVADHKRMEKERDKLFKLVKMILIPALTAATGKPEYAGWWDEDIKTAEQALEQK